MIRVGFDVPVAKTAMSPFPLLVVLYSDHNQIYQRYRLTDVMLVAYAETYHHCQSLL